MSVLVELELESYIAQRFPPLALDATYDPPTALATAWLSQLVYEAEPAKIDAVLQAWGLTREAIVGDREQDPQRLTATRGLVVGAQDARIIAFAGTDPLSGRNWLTDFTTWSSPDDLHAGFDSAARTVWPEVAAQARIAAAAGKTLILTGHSLGAALAAIAAKRIRDEGLAEIASVYTFGMPRTGGERFARNYGEPLARRSFRLVHGDDIVPTLPAAGFRVSLPRGLELDVGVQFRHVGSLVRSGPDKTFTHSQPVWPSNEPFLMATALSGMVSAINLARAARLPSRAQPGWRGRFYRTLPIGIYDHVPAGYLRALGAVLTNEGL